VNERTVGIMSADSNTLSVSQRCKIATVPPLGEKWP